MLTNLFSIFDPVGSSVLSNWLSSLWVFLFFSINIFLVKRTLLRFTTNLIRPAIRDTTENLRQNKWHTLLPLIRVFLSIFTINMLGLFAFNFTPSSHIVLTLTLSLPFWLAFTLNSLVVKTTYFLAHLVPLGTPTPLIPFIVLIETVSSLIRPLTLAIRLAANMVAGHLLLSLLGNFRSFFRAGVGAFLGSYCFFTLELAVALIQRYVFVILLSLYLEEA